MQCRDTKQNPFCCFLQSDLDKLGQDENLLTPPKGQHGETCYKTSLEMHRKSKENVKVQSNYTSGITVL